MIPEKSTLFCSLRISSSSKVKTSSEFLLIIVPKSISQFNVASSLFFVSTLQFAFISLFSCIFNSPWIFSDITLSVFPFIIKLNLSVELVSNL